MRLIDVDALVDKLSDKAKEMLGIAEQCQGSAINYYTGAKYGFAKAAIIANGLPTIEPKRGKWKHDADGLVWCHECGFGKERSDERPYNYCPNCGAKMDGKGQKGEIK